MGSISMDQFVLQTIESLMNIERNEFLNSCSGDKGNGSYTRAFQSLSKKRTRHQSPPHPQRRLLTRHPRTPQNQPHINSSDTLFCRVSFAQAVDTPWLGNFRDLNAAITRMATLAPRGRIGIAEVEEEIVRLREAWYRPGTDGAETDEWLEEMEGIDAFDRVQLAYVIKVCRRGKSLADAVRELISESRKKRLFVH